MESAHRTSLAKGEVGIIERVKPPTLKVFSKQFLDAINVRCAEKPSTISFYSDKLARLLDYDRLANTRIDRIDESLIELYVQHRRQTVSPASVNRELATLRRLLRLALEWNVIDRVPRFHLLPGERTREFVLSFQQEQIYLGSAPQPLHDVATLLLGTGLRIGEALALEWTDVHLKPIKGASFGFLQVRQGKSRNAKRTISLSQPVQKMLLARKIAGTAQWVFTNSLGDARLSCFTVEDQHKRIREQMKLQNSDFVLHSMRHTFLTRLAQTGIDVFTLMKIAGHSSVTVSQRYVHPSNEAMESAFERMQIMTQRLADRTSKDEKALILPTNIATLSNSTDEAVA